MIGQHDDKKSGRLTVEEAAEFMGISKRALYDLRFRQKRGLADGPPFIQIGPHLVRYDRKDLIEYLDRKKVRSVFYAKGKKVPRGRGVSESVDSRKKQDLLHELLG